MEDRMDTWRTFAISMALAYANHKWKPTINNVLHGYDNEGVLVNTPDAEYRSVTYNCGWWLVDQENEGIPYLWGGTSSLEEFDTGLETGKYAGNVPDNRNNGMSKSCIGVDCSGLISVCWNTSIRLTTRSIVEVTSPIEGWIYFYPVM